MVMSRKKKQRIVLVSVGLALLAGATAFAVLGSKEAASFFRTPTEIAETPPSQDTYLRIGGLVAEGSWTRGPTHHFMVTDMSSSIPVVYTGVVPDLFREGQGVVARGYYRNGVFEADEILAKHDESYIPKEVKDSLEQSGHWQPNS